MLELSGLRSLPREQELGDFIWVQDLSVVFLAKTWLEDIQIRLNFGGMIKVCCETKGGGIVIFGRRNLIFL